MLAKLQICLQPATGVGSHILILLPTLLIAVNICKILYGMNSEDEVRAPEDVNEG